MSGRKIDEREETMGKLESLRGIEAKGVDWLWPQRIAAGSLTLLAGEAEVGKSTLALDLAARVSRGGNWPDGLAGGVPGGVLLVSAANHREYTVAPILEAAGADLDQIRVLSEVQVTRRSEEGEARIIGARPLNLMKDLEVLAKMIEETPGCRLVVIDPITSFLGTGANLQGVLLSLQELAARTRVAIVGITHLKGGRKQALERLACAAALTIAARAIWLLTRDPENLDRRLLLPAKNNLTRQRTGLSLELIEDAEGKAPRVEWSSVAVEGNAEVERQNAEVGSRNSEGNGRGTGQALGCDLVESSEGACGTALKCVEVADLQSRGMIAGVLQEGKSGGVEEREETKRRAGGDRGEKPLQHGATCSAGSVQAPSTCSTGSLQAGSVQAPSTGSVQATSTGSVQTGSGQGVRELHGERKRRNVASQNVVMGWKKRKKLKRRR